METIKKWLGVSFILSLFLYVLSSDFKVFPGALFSTVLFGLYTTKWKNSQVLKHIIVIFIVITFGLGMYYSEGLVSKLFDLIWCALTLALFLESKQEIAQNN
ncbi:hypothetical protein [Candidatus Enterococcus ferrettii]|uniref:Uncharacterized protein n=1 Tax=Candidatus Enterococcus ferrettii TaxID=2815324 RepID=A0ABV0EJT3_9ENTE|nr:hypothetical protein [Enterococcus sp. 665A]MBO1338231.1 hypothetical protein [Enterococcus sp. 665A]